MTHPKHPTPRDPAPIWPTYLVPQDPTFPQFYAGTPGTTYGEAKLWASDEFNAECASLIKNQYGGPSSHASRSITYYLSLLPPVYQCVTTLTAFPDLPQAAKDCIAMGNAQASMPIAPQGYLPTAYDAKGMPAIGLNAGCFSRSIGAGDVLGWLRNGLAAYLHAGGLTDNPDYPNA